MNGKALGMIETVGLVPAVEAGDVALKTADITLCGSQAVGAGLVTVLITGDVAAVKAAIDAASAAAQCLGEVRSVSVIARSAAGLDEILNSEPKPPTCSATSQSSNNEQPEVTPVAEVGAQLVNDSPLAAQPQATNIEALSFSIEELKKLKVTKLRRLARQIPTFSIPGSEIKYARKNDLLEAFTQYMTTLEK